jgi:hypothetical protein
LKKASHTAEVLLERLRRTPMRRGSISKARHELRKKILDGIASEGVPIALARRVAFQLAFKFTKEELGDKTGWKEIGKDLRRECAQLRDRLGLVDRQLIAVLPKLSANQVETFLRELERADRSIARTILNSAIEAAEPIPAGRRYLAEYQKVVQQLQVIDPTVARTLANATFAAGAPRKKAMAFLGNFADVMRQFQDSGMARTVAKGVFRAADPLKAAEQFMRDYNSAATNLVSNGIEVPVARALAAMNRFREPR